MGGKLRNIAKVWTAEDLSSYNCIDSIDCSHNYRYDTYTLQSVAVNVSSQPAADIPLANLCGKLNQTQLLYIANCHGIAKVNKHTSGQVLERDIIAHKCVTCPQFVSLLLSIVQAKSNEQRYETWKEKHSKSRSTASISAFPPKPLGRDLVHQTIEGYA